MSRYSHGKSFGHHSSNHGSHHSYNHGSYKYSYNYSHKHSHNHGSHHDYSSHGSHGHSLSGWGWHSNGFYNNSHYGWHCGNFKNGEWIHLGRGDDTVVTGSGNDSIKVGSGNDVVDSGDGNDCIDGGKGDDVINAGAGNDKIDAGKGDDIANGGAGNDSLYLNWGDDLGIYTVAENVGAKDFYSGGFGTDTLLLEMTSEEWLRADVQAEIALFLQFIEDNASQPSPNPHWGHCGGWWPKEPIFKFESLGLTVHSFENLRVTVDGIEQNLFGEPPEPISVSDDTYTTEGEHNILTGNVLDNDGVPANAPPVELVEGPAKGQLTLNEDGTFEYDPLNDFDSLAQLEEEVVQFTYSISAVGQEPQEATVSITVNGTNDEPIAVDDIASTGQTEILTFDVLANDSDIDATDTLTLTAVSIVDSTGAVIERGAGTVDIVDNKVQWEPGRDYNYLGEGETAEVIVSYTISDTNEGEATAQLVITVTGPAAEGSAPRASVESPFDAVFFGTEGDNEFFATEGDDLFVFETVDGNDTITDFANRSDDVLDLQLLDSIDNFSDVESAASVDEEGNTVLEFGEGDSITLLGVNFEDLSQDNFLV